MRLTTTTTTKPQLPLKEKNKTKCIFLLSIVYWERILKKLHLWIMPIILASWKAKIRRITV
jgi:hypothetical protein